MPPHLVRPPLGVIEGRRPWNFCIHPPQQMPFSFRMRTALLAFGGQDVAMMSIGVAPAQARVKGPEQRDVIGVVGVGDDELPQRPEVRLDRVRPRGVGQGEAPANGRSPAGMYPFGPTQACGRTDSERFEPSKVNARPEKAQDLLDPVQLRLTADADGPAVGFCG